MEELRISIEEPDSLEQEEKVVEKPKQTVIIIGSDDKPDNVVDI